MFASCLQLNTTSHSFNKAPLKANYSEELVVERKTLEEALKSTWDAIDQARKDGVIEFETDQWDEYSNILNDVIIEEILNFEPVHDALDEIKNRLAKCGDLRRDELIREWSDLEARVAHDIDFDAGFVDSWKTTFEKASRVGSLDIRVMEYCVSRFRDYVSGEEGLISPTFDDSAQDKLLETFLAFYGETRQKADGHLTKKRSVRTTTSRTK